MGEGESREIFDSAIAATIEASKILACSSNLKTEPKYTLRTRNPWLSSNSCIIYLREWAVAGARQDQVLDY